MPWTPPQLKTNSQWRWVGALFGVTVIALVAALVGAQLADDRAGCGSIDPTDPANYSTITILNDTKITVVSDHCAGVECSADVLPARLAPGDRLTGHAACGVTGRAMTSWRVRSSSGTVLGYIAVDTPRKHDGIVFGVSHASADPRSPTPHL